MAKALDALVVLAILLPGFLSAGIVRLMAAKSEQTEFERVVEALMLSLPIYGFYFLIFGAVPVVKLCWENCADNYLTVFRGRLLLVAAVTFAVGLSWGLVRIHDLHNRLLRLLRLSRRTRFDSVWADRLTPYVGWVQVSLTDGRNIVGWLKQNSEVGEEKTLFLERAVWMVEGLEPIEVPGGRILLTAEAKIEAVMFLPDTKE